MVRFSSRFLWSGALITVLSTTPAAAQMAGPFAAPDVRVLSAEAGSSLVNDVATDPGDLVRAYFRTGGRSEATVRSLVQTGRDTDVRTGVTHLRFEQRVAGLQVHGAYVKAAVSPSGALVHLIENVLDAGTVAGAAGAEARALAAALRAVHGDAVVAPGQVRQDGDTSVFARTSFFHREPTVTRVAVPVGNALRLGYLVETWSQRDNQLHHTLVGGDGAVLGVESRTASDSYLVFRKDPGKAGQVTVDGPAPATGGLSPEGWLSTTVAQFTTSIQGNNVHAYLDASNDNLPDPSTVGVTGGTFNALFDATSQPTTAGNKAVATQNLFYLNNLTHDILLDHGFTESEGNFQEKNFTGQGLASDGVYAEVQDGSGTDNANFATPSDGSNPRMQMYIWTALDDAQVVVKGTDYKAQNATFSTKPSTTGITGVLVIADDGTGIRSDACERFPRNANVAGKVAIVDRGTCNFDLKVSNAARAGAIAVIVANNDATAIFAMGGTTTSKIPAVMVSQADGVSIKLAAQQGTEAIVRATSPAPINRDSSLDSDIVFHEYGHGLTWRMIGSMSGAMSGAIGEGMSDVLALILNNPSGAYNGRTDGLEGADDDVVGEYASFAKDGIRRYPYDTYPLKYSDFAGTSVHADGEIYAAIGWRLRKNFLTSGNDYTADDVLATIVGGMKYTVAAPKFENMRDGMLQWIANSRLPDQDTRRCLVWDAFAAFGVGPRAKATLKRTGGYTITSDTTLTDTGCMAIQ